MDGRRTKTDHKSSHSAFGSGELINMQRVQKNENANCVLFNSIYNKINWLVHSAAACT